MGVLSLGMVLLLAAATGCGKAGGDTDASGIEVIPVDSEDSAAKSPDAGQSGENMQSDGSAQTDDSVQADGGAQTDNGAQAGGNQQDEELLVGSVKSIGNNSIVISQAFEEDENMLVMPGEGSEEEVLVNVYFSESTTYEVKTVKNGGVNGDADVEKRAGSFSDIKENGHLNMTGSYNGADFHAGKVVIYIFV